jgi:hypothetical protein
LLLLLLQEANAGSLVFQGCERRGVGTRWCRLSIMNETVVVSIVGVVLATADAALMSPASDGWICTDREQRDPVSALVCVTHTATPLEAVGFCSLL